MWLCWAKGPTYDSRAPTNDLEIFLTQTYAMVSRYRATLAGISARTGTALPSLITSFSVLHEASAVVPLVGVFYACKATGVGDRVVVLARAVDDSNGRQTGEETWVTRTRDRWLNEGEAWVDKIGRYYGIWGFESLRHAPAQDTVDLGTFNVREHAASSGMAGDVANALVAYCATKALLPVRVGLSLYLAPAFSRRVIDPLVRPILRMFRK
ncbi:hypothetical protein DFH11DRAFT_1691533 [Phellopilus nigrolimitatus]|nr:hypothetical protein DFH11DRAFT_1691533 [Phellopilus nigrolimitatus]